MKFCFSLFICLVVNSFVSISQETLEKKVKIKETKTTIKYDSSKPSISANRNIRYCIYQENGWLVKKGVSSIINLENLKSGYYFLWLKVTEQVDSNGDGDFEGINENDEKFDINNLPPNTYRFFVQ